MSPCLKDSGGKLCCWESTSVKIVNLIAYKVCFRGLQVEGFHKRLNKTNVINQNLKNNR